MKTSERTMVALLAALACVLICSPVVHAEPFAGASGMAQVSDNAYLCVQDTKADRPGSRIGILTVDTVDGGYDYLPLEPDWQGELPHDLESVYGFRTRPGEFLLCESGSYENWTTHEYHIGRIFHIRLEAAAESWDFELLGTFPIPEHIHEIEGMFMVQLDDPVQVQLEDDLFGDVEVAREELHKAAVAEAGSQGKPLDESVLDWGVPSARQPQMSDLPERDMAYLVLCTRGGDQAYEPAMLYETVVDPKSHEIRELHGGNGRNLSVPPAGDPYQRGCSDAYMDAVGVLWIVTCSDNGDSGPFNSQIYRYGPYQVDPGYGYYSPSYDRPMWYLGGLKVEALCGSVLEGSPLAYATDDEGYGGIWRSLGPAPGR